MSKSKRPKKTKSATADMSAAEATVATLIAHGLDTVYALPGVHNDYLFDAMQRASDALRVVHTRHEQGAAYMALGAALATGRPQAYAVVPGPGLLNSGAALLTAHGMSAPVLALIGQIPAAAIGRGIGHLHEITDQHGIIARLVDHAARIEGPRDASANVAKAIRAMHEGRPGPAALECAIDAWGKRARGPVIERPSPPRRPRIDEDAVRRAAKLLGKAKRVLDRSLQIVSVDADKNAHARLRKPSAALTGDAVAVLRQLIDALARVNPRRPSRRDEMQERQARMRRRLQEKLAPQLAFLEAIRAELPENGIYVDEVTQIGFAARLAFPVYKPRTFLSPGYQDNLGWGFATALGAQHARPDVPVLSINGDGGFLYTANELATAMHHRIPLVAVVFNDGAFGNVRRIQEELFGNRLIACDLTNPDFVKYAESFGAAGRRAHGPDELRVALREALARREPTVIEVPLGPLPSPWEFIHMPPVRGR
jgi:thiamine pyrophosphate-dependent acetolactate synthase large subunit-like protein